MFVNGGFAKDEVFRRRFTGLVPGATYYLSIYAIGFNTDNIILPNLLLESRKTDGTLLASTTTGDIHMVNGVPTWQQFQLEFTADINGVADFVVRNNQQTWVFMVTTLASTTSPSAWVATSVMHRIPTKPALPAVVLPTKDRPICAWGHCSILKPTVFPAPPTAINLDNINDEDAVTFGVLCTATTSLTALVVDVNNTGSPSAVSSAGSTSTRTARSKPRKRVDSCGNGRQLHPHLDGHQRFGTGNDLRPRPAHERPHHHGQHAGRFGV